VIAGGGASGCDGGGFGGVHAVKGGDEDEEEAEGLGGSGEEEDGRTEAGDIDEGAGEEETQWLGADGEGGKGAEDAAAEDLGDALVADGDEEGVDRAAEDAEEG